MRTKLGSASLFALCLLISPLANAGVKVLESSGQGVDTGKPTIVKFTARPEDAGLKISIYEVLDQSTFSGSTSSGGTATGYGETVRYVCDAPCTVKIDGGSHTFKFTTNGLNGLLFRVNATGGTQHWEITGGHAGKFIFGVTAFIVGGSMGIVGAIVGDPTLLSLLIVGGVGFKLMVDGQGSVRLVSTTP